MKKKELKIYAIATLVLAFIGVALRLLNLLFFYDIDMGYYYEGSILPKITGIFDLAALAFFLVWILLFLKNTEINTSRTSFPVRLAAMVAVPFFAAYGLFSLYRTVASVAYGEPFTVLSALTVVSGLGSAMLFILVAINKHNKALGVLGCFFGVLWAVSALGASYFDDFIPMNSPDKTIFQLACLSVMLFFTMYIRGVVAAPKKKMYLFFASVAILLTAQSAIPSIVVSLMGGLYRYILLFEDILLLFVCIFFTFVLFSLSGAENEIDEKVENFECQPTEEGTATEDESASAEPESDGGEDLK